MIGKVVGHDSPEYWLAVELRHEVLRKPLGLNFTDEQLASEINSFHFVGEIDGTVLATAMATPIDLQAVKIRQVAVNSGEQGKGYGREIMGFAEDWATAMQYKGIVLHARAAVVEFYLKLGYEFFDEPF